MSEKKGRELISAEKIKEVDKLAEGCTPGELLTISDMIWEKYGFQTRVSDAKTRLAWRVDDRCQFIGKQGELIIARVKRVNERTLSVEMVGTRQKWRVPFDAAERME